MGKLFDKHINLPDRIEKYLIERGFYEDTMNPRFMGVRGYNDLTINEPCLRHDSNIKGDYTLRIFINKKDIYFEVQTPWRAYETSDRYTPEYYQSVEDIDRLLDAILERVIN